jgi:hypothetical protein
MFNFYQVARSERTINAIFVPNCMMTSMRCNDENFSAQGSSHNDCCVITRQVIVGLERGEGELDLARLSAYSPVLCVIG